MTFPALYIPASDDPIEDRQNLGRELARVLDPPSSQELVDLVLHDRAFAVTHSTKVGAP